MELATNEGVIKYLEENFKDIPHYSRGNLDEFSKGVWAVPIVNFECVGNKIFIKTKAITRVVVL